MHPTSHQHDEPASACPHWCRRDHHRDDPADDLLHQSDPGYAALVHGDPRLPPGHGESWADTVVLRLVQRVGSTAVWLEASSEEGRSLHLLLTSESAGRLAGAMVDLLAVL